MSHFKPMDPLDYHISMPVGVQALNFTQVPLQSSCADLRLKPHPLVNKLSIVTPLSQCFPIETKERASLQEMEGPTYEALFSKAIHGKEERSSPPTAKQGLSTANPRNSHAIWAQF